MVLMYVLSPVESTTAVPDPESTFVPCKYKTFLGSDYSCATWTIPEWKLHPTLSGQEESFDWSKRRELPSSICSEVPAGEYLSPLSILHASPLACTHLSMMIGCTQQAKTILTKSFITLTKSTASVKKLYKCKLGERELNRVRISRKLVITVVFYVNESSSSWYLYKNHYKVHKHSPDKHVLWSEKTNVTGNEVTRRKNHNVPRDYIFLVDLHLTARLRGISPSQHSATTLHQFWQFGCSLCTSQLLQHSLRKFHEQIQ